MGFLFPIAKEKAAKEKDATVFVAQFDAGQAADGWKRTRSHLEISREFRAMLAFDEEEQVPQHCRDSRGVGDPGAVVRVEPGVFGVVHCVLSGVHGVSVPHQVREDAEPPAHHDRLRLLHFGRGPLRHGQLDAVRLHFLVRAGALRRGGFADALAVGGFRERFHVPGPRRPRPRVQQRI